MFYTNVWHYGNDILFIGYDKQGNRKERRIAYKPYLFVPSKSKKSKYQTLYNEPVDKVEFDSIRDARNFVERYKDIANFEQKININELYKII